MRLNQYLARYTNLSRRSADMAVADGRVSINGKLAEIGQLVAESDSVALDSQPISSSSKTLTIILNKPTGYVCSRRQQGNTPTIYALLPEEYQNLKAVGRLDKDSSGLLLMTNDGVLANRLAHPSFGKWKEYEVTLDRALSSQDVQHVRDGIMLDDGVSHLEITDIRHTKYHIRMQEGRNRQIRRSFAALGYAVTSLYRTKFGEITLGQLKSGEYKEIEGLSLRGSESDRGNLYRSRPARELNSSHIRSNSKDNS